LGIESVQSLGRAGLACAAGCATGIIANAIAQKLGTVPEQQVVVDNQTGVGCNIIPDRMARPPARGQAVLVATSSTHGTGPALDPKMPCDVLEGLCVGGPCRHRAQRSGDGMGGGITAATAQDLVKPIDVKPGCRRSVANRAFTGRRATATPGRSSPTNTHR
jgi:hypothetical protein